jgi:hypothetical protein
MNVTAVKVVVPERSWNRPRLTTVIVPLTVVGPPGLETNPTKKLPHPLSKRERPRTTKRAHRDPFFESECA